MRRYIIKPVLRIRDVYPGPRILIFTHPGFRISDLGSKNSNKREVWKKKLSYLLLEPQISQNVKLFYFWNVEEKIWANFQRIIELFAQKLFLSSQNYGFGIRDPEKTYSGSRGQKAPDPGSATLLSTNNKVKLKVPWLPYHCQVTWWECLSSPASPPCPRYTPPAPLPTPCVSSSP